MKQQYTAPQSELLQHEFSYLLLEESSLVEFYGGEDAIPTDGVW